MYLYNTLTSQKEFFKPIKGKTVGLYTCGPTVYDVAHLGNLRTFIFEDILKRALIFNGLEVRHIMNITDVDDKTIEAARRKGAVLKNFTSSYTKFFKEDIKKLHILTPIKFAPATAYVKEMIEAVGALIRRGAAYQKRGSVYFRLAAFPSYGRLSHLEKRDLKLGATVEAEDYSKENPADFVLWRAWRKKDGPVFWTSPFGKGRPGWHLECAVIAREELGDSLDIHAGGVDLIFPHHENEIAEAESLTGKQFARFWLHGEHLLVDGQKMAKSLGNFYTLRDVVSRGLDPLAFRYFVLQAHYRSKLNFTWEALGAAEIALKKIWAEARNLQKPKIGCAELENKFKEAIDDDLNTPKALAVLWEALNSAYPGSAKAETLLKFDRVLGLDIKKFLGRKIIVSQKIKELIKRREAARRARDWKAADRLRQEAEKLGYKLEDTEKGTKIIPNSPKA